MNRKQLKKDGRKSFHKHYLLLIFLCLIISLFGTEGSQSVRLLKTRTETAEGEETESILHVGDVYNPSGAVSNTLIGSLGSTFFSSNDVFQSIIEGNLELGEQISNTIEENMPAEIGGNKALGTTSGVLAGLVNSAMSGRFYIRIAQGLFGLTHSTALTQFFFILINLLFFIVLWVFVRNVMTAILRRIFLESRTYEKVPFLQVLYFATVRKWFRVSLTMFLKTLFEMLWSLTIVGGFIKHYSYYLVPYIVAENPGIKGREAITLSRKMMDGHKWEAFVFDLSFIGWYLLSWITVGLSDLFYGFPYRIAGRTEYYVYLRKLAKENNIPGAEALNDIYLYEIAEKIPLYEAYFDIVDLQTQVLENRFHKSKKVNFFVKWFSIWIGRYEDKKVYDQVEADKYKISRGILARDAKSYPVRLSPLYKESKFKFRQPFHFLRAYSVWTLILMFILFCFVGWGWEVSLYLVRLGRFVNRGFMHGPWLPIYGFGGIVVLLICSRFRKHPVVELIVSVVMCGCIEYLGAYMLETRYHERWWNYDGCFLNIHGRVCAEGLIVFGIACMLVVYLIAPFFDYLVSKLPKKVVMGLAIGLLAAFLVDFAYSRANPNMAEGAIETDEPASGAVVYEMPPDGSSGILPKEMAG